MGLAIVFFAALSLLASAPARAAEECGSTSLYVVAHQDDSLLFQSPDLVQDIESDHCVRTVFVTAGDDGKEQPYWLGREEGARAAYAQMAGVANQWTASTTTVAGRLIHVSTLTAMPSISIYYLRLPDGGIDGDGSLLYGGKSLLKLWNSGQPGSTSPPQDGTIEAVDHSATYTYAGLIETLRGLMTALEPQQVLTQNYIVALKGPDHADHAATAKFTRLASQAYSSPHRLVGYRDYESTSSPQNVFGTLLGAKAMAFYTYGQHDVGACASEPACAGSAYEEWLKRQYTIASETTGVVANAGFDQTTAPSTKVTLDGSGSSHTGSGTLEFAWTQTGGSPVTLSGADTVAPSFTTPAHPTVLTFSLTISDETGSSKGDTVKVRVPSSDPTPVAVTGSEQQVAAGAAVTLDGSESWDPNGLPLQYAWIQTGGPAVTLNGSSGAKPTFTAPVGPTELTFTLVVSNGAETSAPASAKVKVAGIAPSFGSGATTTLTTGVAGSFKVEASGSPTPAIGRTGALPDGLTFTDNGDGSATIAGTPAAAASPPAQTASYPLTLTATNSEGKATQSFTLTVFNPGDAPFITSAATAAFTTGVAGSFTVTASGAPAPALTGTGELPPGLSFSDNGDGTATISGTPAAGAAPAGGSRDYAILVAAKSGAGEDGQQLLITVRRPADPSPEGSTDSADSGGGNESGGNGGGNGGGQAAGTGGSETAPTAPTAPQSEPPAWAPIKLARAKLKLPIGAKSRRVVAVEAPAGARVTCTGKLPRGVRCKVNRAGDLVVTVSRAATATGTYKLTVRVTHAGKTARRTLKLTLGQRRRVG